MNSSLLAASSVIVEQNKGDILQQLANALEQAKKEMNAAHGAARQRAAETVALLQQMEHLQDLNDRSITGEEAKELIKAMHTASDAFAGLMEKNKNKGSDGFTLTERMRNDQAQIADRQKVLDLLREIKTQQSQDIEAKREEALKIKEFSRSGLASFLGPVGPMYGIFNELKAEFGEDAKKIGSKFADLIGLKRNELREFDLDSSRREGRESRLYSMLNWNLNKLRGLFSAASGSGSDSITDRLRDFGGMNSRGGGRGNWSTRARRGWRNMTRRTGGLLSRTGARFGRYGASAGRFLGKAGGLALRGLKFGAKLLPGIGAALGAYDLYQVGSGSGNKGKTGEDALGDYATGAIAGASIGMLGGPIGAAIGAVVGMAFTGIVRNWDSLKSSVGSAWSFITDSIGKGWDKIKDYSSQFIDDVNNSWTNVKKKGEEIRRWFSAHIPGFGAIRESISNMVASTAGTVAGKAQNVANSTSGMVGSAAQSISNFAGSVAMPSAGIKSAIVDSAKAKNIDPGYMMALVNRESGFNPDAGASSSSAQGLAQFTSGTWTSMVKNHGAAEGIGLNDRKDPKKNATMAAILTQENSAALQKAGLSTGPAELYAAHMLGTTGGISFLRKLKTDPDMSAADAFPAAAKANPNVFYTAGRARTIAEVFQWFTSKIVGQAQAYDTALASETSSASVSPSTRSFATVPSRAASANIRMPQQMINGTDASNASAPEFGLLNFGRKTVQDIPMVLGDPPYIIVNSGSL